MDNTHERRLKRNKEISKKQTNNLEQQVIFQNLEKVIGSQASIEKNKELESPQQQVKLNTSKMLNSIMLVESDQQLHLGDTSSLLEHNLHYTTLLKAYVDDFKLNSNNKIKNKQTLFNIAIGMLVCVPTISFILIGVALVFMANGTITVLDSLPGMLAALATLLGTFMVIPKMITKYLFNKKEEEHLSDIISKIQDYDKDIRGRL